MRPGGCSDGILSSGFRHMRSAGWQCTIRDCPMTRTWLQRMMQRNDTDLLSYDFVDSVPTRDAWWFRCSIAIVCVSLALFFRSVLF